MLGIVVISIVAVTSVLVYLDATKNKIGKIENEKGMFNLSAAYWAIGSLLLWIVFFPAYLIKRNALIEKAKEFPVEVTGRTLKAVLLAVAGGVMIFIAIPAYLTSMGGNLPTCGGPEVVGLAENVVKNAPAIKALGIQSIKITMPAETNYDSASEKRACRAVLSSPAGDEAIHYSVEWHDKKKNMIWVEIVDK